MLFDEVIFTHKVKFPHKCYCQKTGSPWKHFRRDFWQCNFIIIGGTISPLERISFIMWLDSTPFIMVPLRSDGAVQCSFEKGMQSYSYERSHSRLQFLLYRLALALIASKAATPVDVLLWDFPVWDGSFYEIRWESSSSFLCCCHICP